ncbi:MAG: universal stress protein [Solirubrobacteraceae bacterium]
MFDTIVVGVDGLEGGRDALRLACRLSEPGGEAVAVHVMSSAPTPMRGLEARGREEAEALLARELAATALHATARVTAATSPARGLHRVADQLGAGLLVVGGAHRGAAGRVAAGDVVRSVVQGARQAVAIAPPDDAGAAHGRRVVGVGYDGSPEARAALRWAARLAAMLGGMVRVLCVAEASPGFSPSALYGLNWVAPGAARQERAQRLLAEALRALGNGAAGEAVVGPAAGALEALSHQVSLLVLGSRGYGPVRRTLLGSTADRLVHDAGCPVVIVPRGAGAGGDARAEAPRITAQIA